MSTFKLKYLFFISAIISSWNQVSITKIAQKKYDFKKKIQKRDKIFQIQLWDSFLYFWVEAKLNFV